MKAKDLRVGNYFKPKTSIGIEYATIVGNDIVVLENRECDFYQPILLNEEWLNRLGFDMYGTTYFDGRESEINIDLSTNTAWIADVRNNSYSSPAMVKYVHQLQNLYYALTNTELKIK